MKQSVIGTLICLLIGLGAVIGGSFSLRSLAFGPEWFATNCTVTGSSTGTNPHCPVVPPHDPSKLCYFARWLVMATDEKGELRDGIIQARFGSQLAAMNDEQMYSVDHAYLCYIHRNSSRFLWPDVPSNVYQFGVVLITIGSVVLCCLVISVIVGVSKSCRTADYERLDDE
jgi:hypothetical protein